MFDILSRYFLVWIEKPQGKESVENDVAGDPIRPSVAGDSNSHYSLLTDEFTAMITENKKW